MQRSGDAVVVAGHRRAALEEVAAGQPSVHTTPREILMNRVRFWHPAEAKNRFNATLAQLNESAARTRKGERVAGLAYPSAKP